uniref:Uncharacterized protein n=1 Tax=Anguilla anguilla TaxID=7936 RepID=A0A0E9SZ17_ANGAN
MNKHTQAPCGTTFNHPGQTQAKQQPLMEEDTETNMFKTDRHTIKRPMHTHSFVS